MTLMSKLPTAVIQSALILEDRVFYFSLAISFGLHLVILAGPFYANLMQPHRTTKTVELIYQSNISPPAKKNIMASQHPSAKEQKLPPLPRLLNRTDKSMETALASLNKKPQALTASDKFPSTIKILDQKRNITVPLLKSEKITNPKYLSYHELIRNKIKNRAYLYINDSRFQTGEVYLTFVLEAKGTLSNVKIIDDKTSANDYLKSVGLRSIKESSPFPAFPSDLKYPELTFNVVISFEMGD
jgi:outer membrane biosynthesis protein TonB